MAEEMRHGIPTAEQLERINAFTKRPFTADELYTFSVKMIGDALIPNRYIKLDKSLLEVYVKDAQAGNVAFMLNHRWANFFDSPKGVFNMGRVFDSHLEESHDVEGETVAQFGSVYIPRGRVKDGVSTDEVIQSIEDGSLRDVSVGIGWQEAECSVCGNSYYSSKCEHWAGREYDGKLCYIIAKPPGDQFELSGVFAGAYPTAEVLSKMAQDARMEEVVHSEDLKRIEEGARIQAICGRNNMTLWVPKDAIQKKASIIVASTLDKEGGEKLETENKETLTTQETTDTQQETVERPASAPENDALSINRQAVIDVLGKEMSAEEILRLAKDGQTLKADLLNDVLEWGVRADGNAFARDTFATLLASASVEQLKEFRESFKAKAKEALKPGRVTEPMDKASKKTRNVPDEAFEV